MNGWPETTGPTTTARIRGATFVTATVTTVLILTVGGSHQPLLRSIEEHRPDRVEFLCSGDAGKLQGSYVQVEGEGKVLKSDPKLAAPDLPCLATLARLETGSYRIRKID